jgi:hypothetical protein
LKQIQFPGKRDVVINFENYKQLAKNVGQIKKENIVSDVIRLSSKLTYFFFILQ